MADGRGAVAGIDEVVVDAGDGDGLCRAKVAGGEGQCSTDGRHIGSATGGGDGDIGARLRVEDDGVGRRTAVFSGGTAGRRQGDTGDGDVVVVGGEGEVADRDAAVAATAGGVADGRGAVAGIDEVVVNAGDGDGLWREPVAGGEGQCATDVRRRVVATGGGDGDAAGGRGIK